MRIARGNRGEYDRPNAGRRIGKQREDLEGCPAADAQDGHQDGDTRIKDEADRQRSRPAGREAHARRFNAGCCQARRH